MLRHLSPLESFYVEQDITIVTICDLEGTINTFFLQKAIDMLMKIHPLLSAEITKDASGNFFSTQENSVNKLIVKGEINDKDKRKQAILFELNHPLAQNNLIRFTLLLEHRIGIIKSQALSLLITTHHAISDGISCAALQQHLWKFYNDLAQDKASIPDPFPLMPAVEDLIPKEFSQTELDDYITQYIKKHDQNETVFTLPRLESENTSIELNYIQKKLTIKQTKAVLDNCQKQGTSVNGAICAAHLLALHELFAQEGALKLSCHSPINLRVRLNPAIPSNAMFTAACGFTFEENVTAETTFWQLAGKIAEAIVRHIDNNDIFKSLLTYDQTRLKFIRNPSIVMSNIGVINLGPKLKKLKLLSVNIIPRVLLPSLAVTAATSANKLTMIYPYSRQFFSTNNVKNIAELTTKYLLKNCPE